MGLAKRVIPCLDVTAGRVVKGVHFVGLRDAGDPVEIAARYDADGVADVRRLLNAGADKVSINTAAVQSPELVREAASIVGAQCIVVAIDAKRAGESWEVYTHGGRRATGLDAVDWARRMSAAGAGEILLTSMDRDGTRDGFDLALTRAVSEAVPVPVIASGGAGNLEHLAQAVLEGRADAVLAASIFHFGEYSVRQAKEELKRYGIEVRE